MGPKKRGAATLKQARRLITIKEKKEIIEKHENGIRIVDLAAKYNMATSSIATILKNKEVIKAAEVATGVKILSSQRNVLNEQMEKLLIVWINEKQISGNKMTQKIVCEKARSLYSQLKKNSPRTSTTEEEEDFKASRGWFQNFKNRTGIHIGVKHDESTSTNRTEAENFAREFQGFVINEGCEPEQAFNVDEYGLFWKKIPSETCVKQEEECSPEEVTVCKELWPPNVKSPALGESLTDTEAVSENSTEDKTMPLIKIEVKEEYIDNLVEQEEHLETFRNELKREREEEEMECSSEKESNWKETIPSADITKMFHHWEEFRTLALRWHPNKAEIDQLCSLVEDKCLNYFKGI